MNNDELIAAARAKCPHWDYLKRAWYDGFDNGPQNYGTCSEISAWHEGQRARKAVEATLAAAPTGFISRRRDSVAEALAAFGPDHDTGYLWAYTHGTRDMEELERSSVMEVVRLYAGRPA